MFVIKPMRSKPSSSKSNKNRRPTAPPIQQSPTPKKTHHHSTDDETARSTPSRRSARLAKQQKLNDANSPSHTRHENHHRPSHKSTAALTTADVAFHSSPDDVSDRLSDDNVSITSHAGPQKRRKAAAQVENLQCPKKKKASTKKSKNAAIATPRSLWTDLEVELLTRAYINAHQDHIRGCNQRSAVLWSRVFSNLTELWSKKSQYMTEKDKEDDKKNATVDYASRGRNQASIQGHWSKVIAIARAFHAVYSRLNKDPLPSGWVEATVISESLREYSEKVNIINSEALKANPNYKGGANPTFIYLRQWQLLLDYQNSDQEGNTLLVVRDKNVKANPRHGGYDDVDLDEEASSNVGTAENNHEHHNFVDDSNERDHGELPTRKKPPVPTHATTGLATIDEDDDYTDDGGGKPAAKATQAIHPSTMKLAHNPASKTTQIPTPKGRIVAVNNSSGIHINLKRPMGSKRAKERAKKLKTMDRLKDTFVVNQNAITNTIDSDTANALKALPLALSAMTNFMSSQQEMSSLLPRPSAVAHHDIAFLEYLPEEQRTLMSQHIYSIRMAELQQSTRDIEMRNMDVTDRQRQMLINRNGPPFGDHGSADSVDKDEDDEYQEEGNIFPFSDNEEESGKVSKNRVVDTSLLNVASTDEDDDDE